MEINSSTPPSMAIFTHSQDMHALAVQQELRESHGVDCAIIETDSLSSLADFSWSIDNTKAKGTLADDHGNPVSLSDIDLIWWRRVRTRQRVRRADESGMDMVDRSCRVALQGAALSEFSGIYVNDPWKTFRAENKICQLLEARRAGFRVPRTLISSDPQRVRNFAQSCPEGLIAKPLAATTLCPPIFTQFVREYNLLNDESIRACPTIFQEYIPGALHLRIQVFGELIIAASIKASDLDWRRNLDVPIKEVAISDEIHRRIGHLMQNLGLRMGIIDMKVNEHGDPVWLEINPQGQFLFLEGICGLPLTAKFAEFLVSEGRVMQR